METTDNLKLPYLMPSQAQKHVTHNEALAILDAIIQFAVLDRDLATPPGSPDDGDRYIVAAGATGAWDGEEGNVAVCRDGGWSFLAPRVGWLAYVADEEAFVHYTGSAWQSVDGTISSLQNLDLLGVGTTADATSPFSAKLNKALWTAKAVSEGGDGDLRYTMNKEAAGNVLSLLLQSGWSGRAELGLIGDDDFGFKVSADGTSWISALKIEKTTGYLQAAAGMAFGGAQQATQYTVTDVTPNVQINSTGTAASFMMGRWSANTGPGRIFFAKSRGSAVGMHTAVAANDELGGFAFAGSDGTAFRDGAHIRAVVAGAPVSNRTPTRLVFDTTDGSAAVGARVSVEPGGELAMGPAFTPVIDANRHHRLREYTVATLPSASPAAQMIYVSDGSSNRRLAVSDGTNWRFADGNPVS